MFRLARILLGIFLLSTAASVVWSQAKPDFSGLWRQDNDRCEPKRKGEVTLRIEQRDGSLAVETSISNSSTSPRHAMQTYTTDGKVSVSTGADGDQFNTAVVWNGSSLVFSIEEHEDGRILLSKETWLLIEDGTALERVRERPNQVRQTLFFRRMQVNSSENKPGSAKVGER